MPLKIVIHKFSIQRRQQNHNSQMETESLSDLNVQRQYYYYCKPDENKTAIFQHNSIILNK